MIKSYIEFINELKITTRTSGSGSTKEIENILDEPTTNKSLSAGLMLRNKLRGEESSQFYNFPIENIKKPILNTYRDKPEALKLLINNLEFLKDELKNKGELRCEYCNKGPLVIYDTFHIKVDQSEYIKQRDFVRGDGATCDHKNPRSKGGDRYDKNNLAVCCFRCNRLKGDKSYEDWMYQIKNHIIKKDDEPSPLNKDYKRILNKIESNKIFLVDTKKENEYISFSSLPGYDYLNIGTIIKLIIRNSPVKLEKMGDRKYIINFNSEINESKGQLRMPTKCSFEELLRKRNSIKTEDFNEDEMHWLNSVGNKFDSMHIQSYSILINQDDYMIVFNKLQDDWFTILVNYPGQPPSTTKSYIADEFIEVKNFIESIR